MISRIFYILILLTSFFFQNYPTYADSGSVTVEYESDWAIDELMNAYAESAGETLKPMQIVDKTSKITYVSSTFDPSVDDLLEEARTSQMSRPDLRSDFFTYVSTQPDLRSDFFTYVSTMIDFGANPNELSDDNSETTGGVTTHPAFAPPSDHRANAVV